MSKEPKQPVNAGQNKLRQELSTGREDVGVLSPGARLYERPVFEAKALNWAVEKHLILNDLDFAIPRDQITGVIGPNGAGKSTLLRCLFAKNKLTSGSLKFDDRSIDSFSRRVLAQKVAVVLQEPPSHFDLTVGEIVAMGAIPHQSILSFSSASTTELVHEAAKKVDLVDKVNRQFNSLSGGEKQRVLLAKAIVQRPQVLILDEPTNHLDIAHQIEIMQLVKSMKITVVISIHDLNLASAFCDQLILLDHGKIVAQGQPEDVLGHDNLKRVFNVTADIDSHPYHQGQRITFDFSKVSS